MNSPFSDYQERKRSEGGVGCGHLAETSSADEDLTVEPPIEHGDLTTIMGMLGDIRFDVAAIRRLMEDENGEEEADEADD